MRLIVHCTGGGMHTMMLLDTTTVSDVKQLVADKEGVEPLRQLLRFAGRPLAPDSARLLGDLGLDQYSLAQEVVVHMQRQLAQPVQLFLAQPPALAPGERRPPVAAVVDAGAALADVTALVRAYGLVPAGTTTSMLPAAPAVGGVVAHRADGSCVSGIALNMTDSVESLLDALAANMDYMPRALTCSLAQDGHLHLQAAPQQTGLELPVQLASSGTPQLQVRLRQRVVAATQRATSSTHSQGGRHIPLAALARQLAVEP